MHVRSQKPLVFNFKLHVYSKNNDQKINFSGYMDHNHIACTGWDLHVH